MKNENILRSYQLFINKQTKIRARNVIKAYKQHYTFAKLITLITENEHYYNILKEIKFFLKRK